MITICLLFNRQIRQLFCDTSLSRLPEISTPPVFYIQRPFQQLHETHITANMAVKRDKVLSLSIKIIFLQKQFRLMAKLAVI